MTNEEYVDSLLSGNTDLRDEAIARLNKGDAAILAISRCKTAFTYVDSGDYAALSIVRSTIEECDID